MYHDVFSLLFICKLGFRDHTYTSLYNYIVINKNLATNNAAIIVTTISFFL